MQLLVLVVDLTMRLGSNLLAIELVAIYLVYLEAEPLLRPIQVDGNLVQEDGNPLLQV